ncbi:MAG TPA: hypothetical protein VIJ66_03375 [Solirubrobacteraceae bacterium]
MQQHPTEGDPVAEEKRIHRLVLNVVVDKHQRPWSVDEIVRALYGFSNKLDVEDALTQLQVIGLVNQADGLVFASQAAAHIDRLKILAI